MQISKIDDQIIKIIEDKYGHSIDKDDPLMLTITAQKLITEHLLDLHKINMETQFNNFQQNLVDLLSSTKIDSEQTKQMISTFMRKTFLSIIDENKAVLSHEFIRAGQELEKAQERSRSTKKWSILSIFICFVCLACSFLLVFG